MFAAAFLLLPSRFDPTPSPDSSILTAPPLSFELDAGPALLPLLELAPGLWSSIPTVSPSLRCASSRLDFALFNPLSAARS